MVIIIIVVIKSKFQGVLRSRRRVAGCRLLLLHYHCSLATNPSHHLKDTTTGGEESFQERAIVVAVLLLMLLKRNEWVEPKVNLKLCAWHFSNEPLPLLSPALTALDRNKFRKVQ